MRTKCFKRKKKIKSSYLFLFSILCICFLTCTFIIKFNQEVTPKLINIAESSINKLNEEILLSYKVKNTYQGVDLQNIVTLDKNKNDEIISVDFNLENVYIALSIITGYLQEKLNSTETRQTILKYYSEDLSSSLDEIVLNIPAGVASDSIYLANLGPKIPVKVAYIGYLATRVRLDVTPYGINNSMIKIYVDCTITNEFIVPNINKEIKHTYSILLVSKIIQGKVPDYYGGAISEKSSILNVPLTS